MLGQTKLFLLKKTQPLLKAGNKSAIDDRIARIRTEIEKST